MKKFICFLLCVILLLSVAACGKEKEETPVEDTSIVYGMLAKAGISEEDFNALINNNAAEPETTGAAITESTFKFYDNFTSMQLAFNSGDIDGMMIPKVVADYMISQGQSITMTVDKNMGYSMLTADQELCKKLDKAITELKKDGTLDSLIVRYLTNYSSMDAVEFETFEGAETITFAVTGDLPPFDYVDASGNAAGFNTAMIAAIASKLGVNASVIQIDSGARAMALSTGKADVVFWMDDNSGAASKETSIDYSDEDLEVPETPDDIEEPVNDLGPEGLEGELPPEPIDGENPPEGAEPPEGELPPEPIDGENPPEGAPEGIDPENGDITTPSEEDLENLPDQFDVPDGTYMTNPFFYDYTVLVVKAE